MARFKFYCRTGLLIGVPTRVLACVLTTILLTGVASASVLATPAGTVTVTGHVFRADSIEASQFSVTFTDQHRQAFTAKTDLHGHYVIDNLTPGCYSAASAVLNYGSVILTNIEINDNTAMDFHLERNGKKVTIKVHQNSGADPSSMFVLAQKEDGNQRYFLQAIRDMDDYSLPLEPGNYEFSARSPNWSGNALRQALTDDQPSRTIHIYPIVGTNPALRIELLNMLDHDQLVRNRLGELAESEQSFQNAVEAMRRVDQQNQTRLAEILAEVGFPDANLVGLDGTEAAYFLLQHGPPSTTGNYLTVLQQLADSGQLTWRSVAMAIDRVLVSTGQQQLYGTQFRMDSHHGLTVHPIHDEDQLDERRKQIGLERFADYKNQLLRMMTVPIHPPEK